MAINEDLYIDQGSDFLAQMPPVTNTAGTVVDLTTYTAACQMRRSYGSIYAINVTATITDPTEGIITLSMLNSETQGLSPLRYVYDVTIISASDPPIITKVFDGLIIVNPGVTDKPVTNIVVPYIPDDFGGI